MYNRPDRPLVVKCSYDSWNKKITFSSTRNCTYDILRHKVEQCFSLFSTAFNISYKDDDGEITIIATDTDLTEAIQYFHAGDDVPLSSAASILSGRSFGGKRVTLRVDITVEYDGPSLSDTGSLVSLEEYKGRNGSQQSFSFGSSPSDLDDDSVTVSSRDNSAASAQSSHEFDPIKTLGSSERFTFISRPRVGLAEDPTLGAGNNPAGVEDPFADVDPSDVLRRLKVEETSPDGWSNVASDTFEKNDRGAAWLKDQNERAIRSRLGPLPEPSVSGISSSLDAQEELGGALELERDPHGRYYYRYTSAGPASQTHEFSYDHGLTGSQLPRPTSMQLNWLVSQQRTAPVVDPSTTSCSDSGVGSSAYHGGVSLQNIDKDLLPFLVTPVSPPDKCTDCSECSVLLDSIRYVCSTCGEKAPSRSSRAIDGKGKASSNLIFTHPPSSLPGTSNSSTYLASSDSLLKDPSIPPESNISSANTLTGGYELCSDCLQSAGVNHAISAGSSHGVPSPVSSEDLQAASQWRRAAPKKGQSRHAYYEKVWGHTGWEDVEQDEARVSSCSTCQAITPRRRYKCASCTNINLCRACYSQVHELHPSHAFLAIPDKRVKFEVERNRVGPSADPNEEQPLRHPGIKCTHCLLDIVGARFHCAICDSVDICANCESAGLPGNLDSADGGHTSSHILIKIPYPLETDELETASRWAIHLWTKDAASMGLPAPRPKPSSVVSSYARTVVGSRRSSVKSSSKDHRIYCNGCGHLIIGTRYQCASCPSSPRAYNLCEDCEPRSYILHDPMHVFFKLPRPVQQHIEFTYSLVPTLYKLPLSNESSSAEDPKAYLSNLVHISAFCDRCVGRIHGEWFRCAYCPLDLCDTCEAVDTHDDNHVFMVFKSAVDMQLFKAFARLDSDGQAPPVIPHLVYGR